MFQHRNTTAEGFSFTGRITGKKNKNTTKMVRMAALQTRRRTLRHAVASHAVSNISNDSQWHNSQVSPPRMFL